MTLILLVGGLAIFLVLSTLVSKFPELVLYALTIFAVTAWDWPVIPAVGAVGGASIFAEDAVAGAMILTTLFRPQRFWSLMRPYSLAIGLTAVALAASLVYGVIEFGPASLNEFRAFLYPLAAVAWALNQDWEGEAWRGVMRRWAIVTGLLLSLVSVTHIALYGVGSTDSFVLSVFSGVLQTGRPLTAGQTVLLALCSVFLLQGLSSKMGADLGWAGLFILMTLLAQHRSVWVALGAAFVVLSLTARGVALARIVVAALMAAWVIAVLVLSGVFKMFSKQFTDSVDNLGTYGARTESWTNLIGSTIDSGLGTIAFGSPFGSGFQRLEGAAVVEWAPHNWYLTVYLRLGLFGLIAFAALLLIVILRLLQTWDAVHAAAAFALILTYCWAYSLTWYAAPFFAWAMWSASKRKPQQVDEKPSLPAAYLTKRSTPPNLPRLTSS